jgi:DNA-binding NtrC family response regulator
MKKILIIDESRFSRVCSAILRLEGYETMVVKGPGQFPELGTAGDYVLLVTSFPFKQAIFRKISEIELPKIILADHLSRDVVNTIKSLPMSFCMVKPLDYQKFRYVVREIVTHGPAAIQGYGLI